MDSSDVKEYWAFISYSHHDVKWATWLHKALESLRIPKALVGRQSPHGPIPARLKPVFRDREELGASADLSGPIRKALAASNALIVICSPRSAQSKWVNEEINEFQKLGKGRHIYCLIIDGHPHAAEQLNTPDLECFPPALNDGIGEEISGAIIEPLAGDARPGKDGRRNAMLKIVAGILGVEFDRLRQRDNERRNRFLLSTSTAAVVLAVVMSGLAWTAVQGRRDAQQSQALQLLNTAIGQADEGNDQAAVQSLLAALLLEPNNQTIVARLVSLLTQRVFPYVVEESALPLGKIYDLYLGPQGEHIVAVFKNGQAAIINTESRRLWYSVTEQSVADVAFDPNGRLLALATREGEIIVAELATEKILLRIKDGRSVWAVDISKDGRHIASSNGHIWRLELAQGRAEMISRLPILKKPFTVSFAAGTTDIVSVHADGKVAIWRVDKQPLAKLAMQTRVHSPLVDAVFEQNKKYLATIGAEVKIWRLADLELVSQFTPQDRIKELLFSVEQGKLIYATLSGKVGTWDYLNGAKMKSLTLHRGAIADLAETQQQTILTASWDGFARLTPRERSYPLIAPMQHNSAVYALLPGLTGNIAYTASEGGALKKWRVPNTYFTFRELQSDTPLVEIVSDDSFKVIAGLGADRRAVRVFQPDKQKVIRLTAENEIKSLMLDNSGAYLYYVQANGILSKYNIGSETIGKQVSVWNDISKATALADKSRVLLQYDNQELQVWDFVRQIPLTKKIQITGDIRKVLLLEQQNLIAVLNKAFNQVQFWDLRTGLPNKHTAKLVIPAGKVIKSAHGADDRLYLVANELVYAYKVANGQISANPIDSYRHPEDILLLALSPAGENLLTAGYDGVLRLWKKDGFTHPNRRFVSGAASTSISFSPDGRWFVAGSFNRTVNVWDSENAIRMIDTLVHPAEVFYSRFDRLGNRILSVSIDGRIKIFETGLHLSANYPQWFPEFCRSVLDGRINNIDFDIEEDAWQQWRNKFRSGANRSL